MQARMRLSRQCQPSLTQPHRAHVHKCSAGRQLLFVRASAADAPSVVITGASSGIDKATAIKMARQGWRVFAGVRKVTDGAALVQIHKSTTPAQPGGSLTPVILDVLEPESIKDAATKVETALRQAGGTRSRLRGLVNNAGKCIIAPLEFMPVEVFEDHLQVNLVGALRVTQAFLPLMRPDPTAPSSDTPGPSGRIINISSQSGVVAYPLFGGYACSKFGLEAFSDVLRYELVEQNIQVICLQPGPVKSDIWTRAFDTSTQVIDRLPPQAQKLYGDVIRKITSLARTAEEKGGTCDELAELIFNILTAEEPRSRYMFGKSATLQMVFRKFLPDRLWDPMVLSSLNKIGGGAKDYAFTTKHGRGLLSLHSCSGGASGY